MQTVNHLGKLWVGLRVGMPRVCYFPSSATLATFCSSFLAGYFDDVLIFEHKGAL